MVRRRLLLGLAAALVPGLPWLGGTPGLAAVQGATVEGTVRCPSRQPAVVSAEVEHALPTAAGSAVIDQRGLRFIPHILPVRVGTRVSFLNSDPVHHNVFSASLTKPFNLGTYPSGETRYVTFDRPGIVEVLCNVHLEMSAVVLVFDTPYFVLTDAEGRYRLDTVPPGASRVSAWCEGYGARDQTVDLLAGANGVDFDMGDDLPR